MTDLPVGWAEATVGEVASLVRGVSYKKEQARPEAENGYSPLLRATNITDRGLVLDRDLVYVPDSVISEDQRLRPGDVVLASSSGSSAVVGKSAMVVQEWIGGFGAFCAVVRTKGIEPRYLGYYVSSPAVRTRWSELARGTNINNLKVGHITETPIPIPSLEEQRRIVAAIEEQLPRLDAAEASLRDCQIRTELFGHRLRDALLDEAWPRIAVGDVAEIRGGIQKQPKRRPRLNKYPFLRVANVQRDVLDLGEVHEIELFEGELSRYGLEAGDLLVVEGNGSRSQIGRSAVWDGSIDPCVHQNHLIRVRPSAQLLPAYLNACWNSAEVTRQIYDVASSTSGLYTLNTTKVASIQIPLPSVELQQQVSSRLEQQQSLVGALQVQIQAASARAASLRGAILRDAFAGQLVAQNSYDEPAAVLLKRIAAEREAVPRSRRRPKAKVG